MPNTQETNPGQKDQYADKNASDQKNQGKGQGGQSSSADDKQQEPRKSSNA
jgi:hypothetical protein